MKNKLLLLAMGIALTTQTLMAQVPSYVPSNGLVAYYPFNANADDASGNKNNGTNNGATLTVDRFGNTNSAYNFNGTSNYIEIKNNLLTSQTSYTINFWAKIQGNQAIDLFNDRTEPSCFYKYRILVLDGKIQFWKYTSISLEKVIGNTVPLNQWVMFTAVFDSPQKLIKIYTNSILNSSLYSTNWNLSQNATTIGGLRGCNTNGAIVNIQNGPIDDVAIFNRVLTQEEISTMYNGVNYSDTCNNVSGSLTQGLVGYWPFCGNANDDSGNGNNGTVNGATLTTDRFGNSNSAYSFNGTSSKISLPLQQNGITSYSVSAWFKTSLGGPILAGRGTSNQVGLTLDVNNFATGGTINNGKVMFVADGPAISIGKSSTEQYIDNQWHNLIGVFNGTSGAINPSQFSIYLDGILVNQYSNTTGSAVAPINNLTNLLIGSHQIWPSGGYFNGIIDDIGIWNRALTQAEVTQLYNQNQCFTNTTVTDTLIINVGQLSYTNPVAYANNITIYPNPANTQVNISFNNITDLTGGNINIINSLGQQVATTPITLSGTSTILSLNTWGGSGMYFVQIINPQGIVVDVKKIILQ